MAKNYIILILLKLLFFYTKQPNIKRIIVYRFSKRKFFNSIFIYYYLYISPFQNVVSKISIPYYTN